MSLKYNSNTSAMARLLSVCVQLVYSPTLGRIPQTHFIVIPL